MTVVSISGIVHPLEIFENTGEKSYTWNILKYPEVTSKQLESHEEVNLLNLSVILET